MSLVSVAGFGLLSAVRTIDAAKMQICLQQTFLSILPSFMSVWKSGLPRLASSKIYRVRTCSSCLSYRFLPRFGLGPRCWRELLDLGDLGRWQAREQIFEIIKRVDLMP